MGTLELCFLGPPRIEKDGQPVDLDTRKATALLAYLAITGEHHRREALALLLWPEMSGEHARAALRRTLSSLRSAVGDEHLYVTRDGLSLLPDSGISCDVIRFEAAIGEVRRHAHANLSTCPACLEALDRAVALYRDHFLTGFSLRDSLEFDDWQLAQTEHLRRELGNALSSLVAAYTANGNYETAVEHARRWLALDPLREEVHRALMQLFAWMGRREAALRQYREAVRVLDEELGVEPLPETRALYEAIQEGRLGPPAAAPQPDDRQDEPMRSATPVAVPGAVPLIGREAAMESLRRSYGLIPPDGQLVGVTGELGIGKTRLVESFMVQAAAAGAQTVIAPCYEGEANLAYAPFTTALQALLKRPGMTARLQAMPEYMREEVARLAPEALGSAPGATMLPGASAAQSRFFGATAEVICSLLSGPQPGILFLDDAHWADAASLDLLAYMARRLADLPFLLLVSWRADEVGADHRLSRLFAEAGRAGTGQIVRLGRWSAADVAALLVAAGAAPEPDAAERLFRETEGLPFFVVEYLTALSGTEAGWMMPQTVRDLLRGRLTAVDQAGRQLLQTAAVIGRSFDYDTLCDASGRSEEEVVAGLEDLLGRGLVREVTDRDGGELRYDFSHPQLRSLAYDEITLARRRLLHRRVAAAVLERARGPQGQDAAAGLAGYHYRLAGQDGLAAAQYRRAGDHARSVYAHREALEHYRTALALGGPDPDLHEASGDLHTLLGEYSAALRAYESAAALGGEPVPGRLEHKLGLVYERRGDWELAENHYAAARDRWLAGDERRALALLYCDWSRVANRTGDAAQARQLAEEALALAESAGDEAARAQSHNTLGMLARQSGDLASAAGHLERSLDLATADPLSAARIGALNNLARLRADAGRPEEALALLEQAIALCARQGDRHHQAALFNQRADVLHQLGREPEALASLKQAVAIYAEIGLEAGDWQPEVWKLAEW